MPVRESRTGTRLVSPAAGDKKKKEEGSATGPRTTKLSTLEDIVVYTDSIGSGLGPRRTITHRKLGKITYMFHIWAFFFLHNQSSPVCDNISSAFSLKAAYWINKMDSGQTFTVCVMNFRV